MKDMLILCTKSVHFPMNGDIYLQIDGVAMGSLKRFVDDTITFANIEATDHILTILDSFDPNIQISFETRKFETAIFKCNVMS